MRASPEPAPSILSANDMTKLVLLGISERFPNMWAWRNNRLDAKVPTGNGMRWVSAGIDGQSDIAIVCGPGSRFGGVEIKRKRDKMRESQEKYRNKVLSVGGFYIVCRSVDQTLAELAVIYRGEGNHPLP